MTPKALRLMRLAIQRQRARETVFTYGRLGGWIGKDHEVLRFLDMFMLWRETHDISTRFFSMQWPHHETGCWYRVFPYSRN